MKQLLALISIAVLAFGPVAFGQPSSSSDSSQFAWDEQYRYYDEPIDPSQYLIRPGDTLSVTFIGAKVRKLSLVVDPEGRIIDETVGVIDLSGSTLADARSRLSEVLVGFYNVKQMAISVGGPRRMAVQVSGAVSSPGLYRAYSSQRVSEVIEQAGGILPGGSQRTIRFSGGPVDIAVDLDRAYFIGDDNANPCLYGGYAIFVPSKMGRIVQVAGEVVFPRAVEVLSNDGIKMILALAGGLRSQADTAQIEIIGGDGTRRSPEGDFRPGDIVWVPSKQRDSLDNRLLVFGAVLHPGPYPMTPGTTLRGLIDRAGGFKSNASEALTTLFRRADVDEWGRVSNTRYPVSSIFNGSDIEMTMLRAGDSIFVPTVVGFVQVRGEVRSPGLFPHQEAQDALFYINLAGGYLPAADRERVYVYNRISRITATFSPGVQIHDGDMLIVNKREELR